MRIHLYLYIILGNLPAPTLDTQGNPQTYYAVFFPPGKLLSYISGGLTQTSCNSFCAYHGFVGANDTIKDYYYGIHPDIQVGLCATNCHFDITSTAFENYCLIASHELIEMITGMFFILPCFNKFSKLLLNYNRSNFHILV
jgi:hypothetical protein